MSPDYAYLAVLIALLAVMHVGLWALIVLL
ncbi:hypothetical protein PMES_00929 [Profundibacterium mesophilum KAUST100406-0324]|uniref:Uncharacterized protein n=1 Tax=Profundibacterium mesophilum KAUST100406-0324 TaxID=1037889 RepID=A0A921NS23_9RHOB|nr:hypothetical protein PMES_00929 [Profundibacterium mesophilum KAUST100406-0324]